MIVARSHPSHPLLLATMILLATAVAAVLGAAEGAASAITHRFVIVDNSKKSRLVLVDQREPAKGWTVAIPGGSRDLQRLPGGLLLVSHGNGCAEYRIADGARQWSLDTFSGVNSAQRLDNGNTLLAIFSKEGSRLLEVDRAGAEVASIPVKAGDSLRLVRRLPNGNTLVAAGHLIEVDPTGAQVRKFQVGQGGKGYVGVRLPDGRTLGTTGHLATVREWDAEGKLLREIGGRDFGGLGLDWSSGFHLLPNGHLVVTNWTGHLKAPTGPQLVEYAADGSLAWQWADPAAVRDATNVLVLDEP